VTAYILIQAAPQARNPALTRQIATIPGIERVQPVTGPYDVIAEVGAGDGDGVLGRVAALEGVLRALRAPVATAVDAAA
jgi:hypothetical protein